MAYYTNILKMFYCFAQIQFKLLYTNIAVHCKYGTTERTWF